MHDYYIGIVTYVYKSYHVKYVWMYMHTYVQFVYVHACMFLNPYVSIFVCYVLTNQLVVHYYNEINAAQDLCA